MFELIIKLHRVLNELKDFIVAYSTAVNNKMIILYKDKLYKVTFEELDRNPNNDDIADVSEKIFMLVDQERRT